jgi:AcrR family transcriptional regulator
VAGAKKPAAGVEGPSAALDGNATRRRLMAAAIDCIVERGYYRASSNEIARRAGVSWGVIQYYFGTRERLMLAVFEAETQRLIDESHRAVIVGETAHEQMTSYFEFLVTHYCRPEHQAYLEIPANLSRDPDTSNATMAVVQRILDDFPAQWVSLSAVPPHHRALVHDSMRGLIMMHLLRPNDSESEFRQRAERLIEALANFVTREETPPPPADDGS